MAKRLLFFFYILFVFFSTLTVFLMFSSLALETIRPILWIDLFLLLAGITTVLTMYFQRRLQAWLRLRRIWKTKRSQMFLREQPLR